MDSPQLARPIELRDRASDPIARAIRSAEIGICLARIGEHDLAQQVVDELRREFADRRSGHVAIRLMMLEALLAYFKDLSAVAYDRMSRAHLLSSAGRDRPLMALTSAWLAHIDFNLCRYREMTRALEMCVSSLSNGDSEALCRLSLTLGDVYLYCDRPEISKAWYSLARDEAVRLGDHSSIGALTYNRAALGVFVARIGALQAPVDPSALALLNGEVRTATNYQSIARLRSLRSLLDSALASIGILRSDFPQALVVLDTLISSGARVAIADTPLTLKADRVLCYAHVGREVEALQELHALDLGQLDSLACDDRAIALATLATASEVCERPAMAAEFRSRVARALIEHKEAVKSIFESLTPYVKVQAVLSGFAH